MKCVIKGRDINEWKRKRYNYTEKYNKRKQENIY